MDTKLLLELVNKYNLKFLILFGSRATNKQRKDSDWDFAFLPKKKLTTTQEMNLFDKMCEILNTDKLDLVNLSKTNNLELKYQISRVGKLINEREEEFKAWKADVWFEYLDFQFIVNNRSDVLKRKLGKMMG